MTPISARVKRWQAYLDDKGEAITSEGQKGIYLLLSGSLPFQAESQGHCGLLQLNLQARHRRLEGVANLQPTGGVFSIGPMP